MARVEKGPLGEFAGQVIAERRCTSCERPVVIKVNRSGWPYAICPHRDGCGYHQKAQSITAARHVLAGVTRWAKGKKEKVLALLVEANSKPESKPEKRDRSADADEGGFLHWG